MLKRSVRTWIITSPASCTIPPVMLTSPGALLCFGSFIGTSMFYGSMDDRSIVEVAVGSPCESAEALRRSIQFFVE